MFVGAGALTRLAEDLAVRPPGRPIVVVCDSNVAPLHGEPFRDALRERGVETFLLRFEAGEPSKTRATKAALEDRLFDLGAGRETVIVALGGGVTGDLAGFLAATWHRGAPLVHAPTSLVAMADAALGGKTGVDLPGGKNLIGAYHQPWGVYADVGLLATLPEPELRGGFAEVVKTACVADAALFRWLEASADALVGRDGAALERAVASCLALKARIVRRDERESSGRRAALNFGHTVAHAAEAVSGYRLAHGPAVALGLLVEASVAVEQTGFPPAHLRRLDRLLGSLGLDTRWPREIPAQRVVDAAARDKKSRGGRLRCSLPSRIGHMPRGADATREVDETLLLRAIRERA